MSDKTYNGWTNWETWLVNLWFGDALQSYVEEDRIEDPEDLKDYAKECLSNDDEKMQGFMSDVLNGFWNEVNWRELLKHYREDLGLDDEEEAQDHA